MHIELVHEDKHEVELKLDNQTVAEILRVYLNSEGADFAAWRREHPSKPLILKIKSGDTPIKKLVSDSIKAIKKDCDSIIDEIKKK